jgi:hypothetical protein
MANKTKTVTESGETVIGGEASPGSKFSKPVSIPRGGSVEKGLSPKKAEIREQEIKKARSRSSTISAATRKRRKWEQSEEGKNRLKNASDLARNVDGSQGVNMPVGMVYELLGFNDSNRAGPAWYDQQLPGMADPNAAPRPPRWDELTPEQQSHTTEALRRHGTSIEQMSSDFGAQLDQAHMRARENKADHPFSEMFYEPGSPQRETMRKSASEVGLPMQVYAPMHGMTSPNTKFQSKRGADHPQAGETYFPNDESVVNVAKQVDMGIPSDQVTNDLNVTGMGPGRSQGYVTNMRKAALSLEQFHAGVAPADWKTSSGSGPFDDSPKTGPYANTWSSDSHPEFFVSDVHSGGGGMLPHLGSEKPIRRDAAGNPIVGEDGKPKRDKSEREKAIASIPYFHAASDHASRMALSQRNLSSLRRGQAAEWGEEQIQRGLVKEEDVYPPKKSSVLNPDQLSLF